VVAGGYRFHKLGTFAWLALAVRGWHALGGWGLPAMLEPTAWPAPTLSQMLSLETLLVVKFGRGLYPAPWPRAVTVSWALAGAAFAVLLLVWQWRLSRAGGSSSASREEEPPAASSSSASREEEPPAASSSRVHNGVGKGSKGL
jgi:hypothetical protein